LRQKHGFFTFHPAPPSRDLPLWPRPIVTDAQGRFTVRGFGRGQAIDVLIEDDRFAVQTLTLQAADGSKPKEVRRSLAAPQKIEGRVLYEDTRKPGGGVQVTVVSYRNQRAYAVNGRADAAGRFRMNPYPGQSFTVSVSALPGQPYLGVY